MKVVLDTNILFAAFTFDQGTCASVLRSCISRYEMVLSEHILSELRRHLSGKGKLSAAKVDEVIAALRDAAVIVAPTALPQDACRDVNDIPVLGTAIAGGASLLVTGDKDLLVLRTYRSIEIIPPREFVDRFVVS